MVDVTPEKAMQCLCEWQAGACRHCGGSNDGISDLYRYCEARCPGIWDSFRPKRPGQAASMSRSPISLPRVALGGAVERMLTAIGITKERVQEWTRTKDCGCEARQRWLDQWGYAQQEKLERLLNRAAKFYFGSLDAAATVNGERDADAPQATTAEGQDAKVG